MTKKIKVLQLGSPSGLYGAERWILALIKYLDSEKVESWVGSIKDEVGDNVPLCVEAERLGFPVVVLESFGKVNFSAAAKLRKFIREHGIDILHTHGYKTDLVGRIATLGTPCKIVSTPHGWTNKPGLKLGFYEILDRLAFPFFDMVAPLSGGILDQLRLVPGLSNKLRLIQNGVDINEIERLDVVSDDILSLKSGSDFIIGYIGRLTPGKGLDILFRAVAEYGEPGWQIVIIGEGEQLSELEMLAGSLGISDKTHFLGFREDRLSMLIGFDVFVLPSRSEGIPRCLMEAMAAKVPVVASDIPGCRYLVDGKSTGLLHEVDNHEDLAESLKKIACDRELRGALQSAGKEFINTNYSAARMAKEYEELFLEILEI